MGLYILIGLAAGAASALLVACVAAGTLLAVPLFYLAPLPVMIAGLAFSNVSALIAVISAAAGLGLIFGATFLTAYLVGIGGPAFGLAYMALMARSDPAARDGLVWFPLGWLVLAAAAFSTVSIAFGLLSTAGDFETYRNAVVTALEGLLNSAGQLPGLPGPGDGGPSIDPSAMGSLVAHILPAVAGGTSMVSLLICLYLAGRAALFSQRLARPWPDLDRLKLPQLTSLLLAVLLTLSVASGLFGLIAITGAATVTIAYVVAGFSALHFITRGMGLRLVILSTAWFGTLILGWPALALAFFGLLDAMFDFRGQASARRGPPAANDR